MEKKGKEVSSKKKGAVYRAIYQCEAEDDLELSFKPNDIFRNVTESEEPGWLIGELNGKTGLIPENYVEKINGKDQNEETVGEEVNVSSLAPETKSKVMDSKNVLEGRGNKKDSVKNLKLGDVLALYHCEAEDEFELSFKPGDIMTNVKRSTEQGWLEGELNGKVGLIPENYVEFIEKEKKSDAEGENEEKRFDKNSDVSHSHIMISYVWSDQSVVLKIKDKLKQAGYNVWIDIEQIEQESKPYLEAMANAVERAAVVLICMSQKYKDSSSVRTEVEHALRLGKTIIPLRVQKRYNPDGWLAFVVGMKRFYDFSKDEDIDQERFTMLIEELGDRGKIDIFGLPEELLKMDKFAISVFKEAVKKGKRKIYKIRVMIVGHYGVGKTTLTRGLLKDDKVDFGSTDGIDIYVGRCEVDTKTGKWIPVDSSNTERNEIFKKLVQILQESKSTVQKTDEDKKDDISNQIKDDITENNIIENTNEEPAISKEKIVSHFSAPKSLLEKSIEESKKPASRNQHANLEIWDFGGQSIFYTTHQTFLSPRCVYFVVFDVSKDFKCPVDDASLIPGETTKSTAIEFLRFWINSIFTYARSTFPEFPKIVVIPTHLDKIPKENRQMAVEQAMEYLEKEFMDHPAFSHLIFNRKCSLDATNQDDEGFEILRNTVFELAKEHPFWGEERPAAWLPLEDMVQNIKEMGRKILSLQEFNRINEESEYGALEEKELEVFLKFQHELGNILFFPEPSLRHHIILHPKWVIDAFRALITEEQFCCHDKPKHKLWIQLSENGILEASEMKSLWSHHSDIEFHQNKEHLLQTMERLDLIVKPKVYDHDGNARESKHFLIPAMVKKIDDQLLIQKLADPNRTTCMVIYFEGGFLPAAVFNRLVASCIAIWPVHKDKQQKLLFSGICCFDLDMNHILTVKQVQHLITVCVTHREKQSMINTSLCIGLKHFFQSSLRRISDLYVNLNPMDNDKTVSVSNDLNLKLHVSCCVNHPECIANPISELPRSDCKHHLPTELTVIASIWNSPEVKKPRRSKIDEDCPPVCTGLTESFLEQPLSFRDVGRLSRRLASPPENIAIAADIEPIVLDEFKSTPLSEVCLPKLFILLEWLKLEGKDLTLKVVQDAIEEYFPDNNIHVLCKLVRVGELYKKQRKFGIPHEKMFSEPTDQVLDRLALRLSPRYAFDLAIELGLIPDEIERVRADEPNQSLKQTIEFLRIWKYKYQGSTYAKLEAALLEIRRGNAVLEEIIQND